MRRPCPRACASSAACSIRCSRRTTRRKACPPSPRSASRGSRTSSFFLPRFAAEELFVLHVPRRPIEHVAAQERPHPVVEVTRHVLVGMPAAIKEVELGRKAGLCQNVLGRAHRGRGEIFVLVADPHRDRDLARGEVHRLVLGRPPAWNAAAAKYSDSSIARVSV